MLHGDNIRGFIRRIYLANEEPHHQTPLPKYCTNKTASRIITYQYYYHIGSASYYQSPIKTLENRLI